MILFPGCKINIGLDILRRRPDGYHDIETVMMPVGWSDILEMVPAADGEPTTLTVTGRHVACPTEKNLVMKAWRALEAALGAELPATAIYLHKIVPDGAGLGGGSADAAFTLVGANRLWQLGLDDSYLAEVGASVGADCPLFIHNRPMLATGTGTTLTPVEIGLGGVVVAIVKPAESVPTAAAYAGVTPRVPVTPLSERLAGGVDSWRGSVVNDFEATVGRQLPVVESIKSKLYDMGALYAAMSGSGSAVYGLFAGEVGAERLQSLFPSMTVWTGTLDTD